MRYDSFGEVLLKYTGADVFECPALRERKGRTPSSERRRRKRCDANIAELIPHRYDVLRVDVGAPRQMTRVEARYELVIHASSHMVTAESRWIYISAALDEAGILWGVSLACKAEVWVLW